MVNVATQLSLSNIVDLHTYRCAFGRFSDSNNQHGIAENRLANWLFP